MEVREGQAIVEVIVDYKIFLQSDKCQTHHKVGWPLAEMFGASVNGFWYCYS